MTEDQTTTTEDEAVQIRAEALQRFWMTSMENIVKGGASEREASMHMLTVASAYLGRSVGAEGAMQLLSDQAIFFGQMAKAKDEAVAEAADASKHRPDPRPRLWVRCRRWRLSRASRRAAPTDGTFPHPRDVGRKDRTDVRGFDA